MSTAEYEQGTGVPTIIDIGGRKRSFRRLGPEMYGYLLSWVRGNRVAAAMLAGTVSGFDSRSLAQVVIELNSEPITEGEISCALRSRDGLLFLLYRSMVHDDPSLTYEAVCAMFPPNRQDDFDMAVSAVLGSGGDPEADPRKTTATANESS